MTGSTACTYSVSCSSEKGEAQTGNKEPDFSSTKGMLLRCVKTLGVKKQRKQAKKERNWLAVKCQLMAGKKITKIMPLQELYVDVKIHGANGWKVWENIADKCTTTTHKRRRYKEKVYVNSGKRDEQFKHEGRAAGISLTWHCGQSQDAGGKA